MSTVLPNRLQRTTIVAEGRNFDSNDASTTSSNRGSSGVGDRVEVPTRRRRFSLQPENADLEMVRDVAPSGSVRHSQRIASIAEQHGINHNDSLIMPPERRNSIGDFNSPAITPARRRNSMQPENANSVVKQPKKRMKVFDVEEVLDHRMNTNGELEYYVKWEGFSDNDNSWTNDVVIRKYENKKRHEEEKRRQEEVEKLKEKHQKVKRRPQAAKKTGVPVKIESKKQLFRYFASKKSVYHAWNDKELIASVTSTLNDEQNALNEIEKDFLLYFKDGDSDTLKNKLKALATPIDESHVHLTLRLATEEADQFKKMMHAFANMGWEQHELLEASSKPKKIEPLFEEKLEASIERVLSVKDGSKSRKKTKEEALHEKAIRSPLLKRIVEVRGITRNRLPNGRMQLQARIVYDNYENDFVSLITLEKSGSKFYETRVIFSSYIEAE